MRPQPYPLHELAQFLGCEFWKFKQSLTKNDRKMDDLARLSSKKETLLSASGRLSHVLHWPTKILHICWGEETPNYRTFHDREVI